MAKNYFGRWLLLSAAGLLTATSSLVAGTQDGADKEVAAQVQAAAAFPVQFSLTVGGDSQYIFRGIDILPEVDINPAKAFAEGINALPAFRSLLETVPISPKAFIATIPEIPNQSVQAARDSGIVYVDLNATTHGFTLGGFFTTQVENRPKGNFFGSDPVFDEYREFDAYARYAHTIGPVNISLGGTYYHVTNSFNFDTAEMNFKVTYTPKWFQYVTASFSYDYAAAFAYKPQYLDGNHLELRVSGYVPLYKQAISFDPYTLISAGSGIVPRAFNSASLPTYFSNSLYASAVAEPVLRAVLSGRTEALASFASAAEKATFDPENLDRDFDLSNFQMGFRIPVRISRILTLTADGNFSYPLGNLRGGFYNQKDQFWAGASVNLSF